MWHVADENTTTSHWGVGRREVGTVELAGCPVGRLRWCRGLPVAGGARWAMPTAAATRADRHQQRVTVTREWPARRHGRAGARGYRCSTISCTSALDTSQRVADGVGRPPGRPRSRAPASRHVGQPGDRRPVRPGRATLTVNVPSRLVTLKHHESRPRWLWPRRSGATSAATRSGSRAPPWSNALAGLTGDRPLGHDDSFESVLTDRALPSIGKVGEGHRRVDDASRRAPRQ